MVWRFIPAVRTERLVFVASTDPRPEQSQAGMADGIARAGVSIPDLVDWSARANTFEEFAAFTFQSAALTGLDVPSRIFTVQATRNLLDVWGITPQIGRTFAADEATPGRERVIVVSHTFWQRQLSAARTRSARLCRSTAIPTRSSASCRPTASRGIFRTIDAVTPIVLDRERGRRDDRRLYVTAVLKPGVKARAGRSRLTADRPPAADRLPADQRANRRRRAAAARAARREHQRRRLPALADRHDRVLHCLRERLEHHSRAGRDATPRAGRPLGPRRGTAQQCDS